MKSDEVIDEIRAVRENISAKYGHDIHRHLQHLREMEDKSSKPVLKPSAKIQPDKQSV
jgi:hypothetical protein